MSDNGLGATIEERVFNLAREVSGLKSKVDGIVENLRSVQAQLWYVAIAAIIGPIVATMVQHWLWK